MKSRSGSSDLSPSWYTKTLAWYAPKVTAQVPIVCPFLAAVMVVPEMVRLNESPAVAVAETGPAPDPRQRKL